MLHCDRGAVSKRVDHVDECGGTEHGKALKQGARGLESADWLGALGKHRAGVEFRHQLEHVDAGSLVAGHDGVLHRRCPPPPWQQRKVQVDPAEAGCTEQGLAHQAAIGDDHAEVWGEGGDLLANVWSESIGEDALDAGICRARCHRGRREHTLPTDR